MPPSSQAGFPRYPGRQRWSQVAAGNSSSKDTVVQVEPGGHSPPGIIHLPFLGVKKRPVPHVPAFLGHPLQEQWLAPATSWVFHMLELYMSPTSPTHLLEVWGRGTFTFSSSELLAGPWRKQVTSGPNSSGPSKLKSSVASASPLDSEPLWEGWYSK